MTRRTFGQSLAGGIMGVFASAWCPGALRAVEPVRAACPPGTRWATAERIELWSDMSQWTLQGFPSSGDDLYFLTSP